MKEKKYYEFLSSLHLELIVLRKEKYYEFLSFLLIEFTNICPRVYH